MDEATFRQEVEWALANLRDVVRLRTSALVDALAPQAPRGRAGWEISRALLHFLDEIRPQPDEPDDWVRQRYNVLALRYVNGLSPSDVAERLAISRRHFYRQLQRALDEFAGHLWSSLFDRPRAMASAESNSTPRNNERDRLALLRQESAPLLQSEQRAYPALVAQSCLGVLAPLLKSHDIAATVNIPESLPPVALGPEILKQLLLELLADLCKHELTRSLSLNAFTRGDALCMRITVRAPAFRDTPSIHEADVSSKPSVALARMHGVRLVLASAEPDTLRCDITLPVAGANTVLVVDDNEEVGLLLKRYLASGGYQYLIALSGAEAIELARSHALYAVTLDLMMDNEDGWDVLQTLRHDPKTSNLPIIVCSVLDQEELALTLGATAFLRKPVMRDALLRTLEGIRPGSPQTSETS